MQSSTSSSEKLFQVTDGSTAIIPFDLDSEYKRFNHFVSTVSVFQDGTGRKFPILKHLNTTIHFLGIDRINNKLISDEYKNEAIDVASKDIYRTLDQVLLPDLSNLVLDYYGNYGSVRPEVVLGELGAYFKLDFSHTKHIRRFGNVGPNNKRLQPTKYVSNNTRELEDYPHPQDEEIELYSEGGYFHADTQSQFPGALDTPTYMPLVELRHSQSLVDVVTNMNIDLLYDIHNYVFLRQDDFDSYHHVSPFEVLLVSIGYYQHMLFSPYDINRINIQVARLFKEYASIIDIEQFVCKSHYGLRFIDQLLDSVNYLDSTLMEEYYGLVIKFARVSKRYKLLRWIPPFSVHQTYVTIPSDLNRGFSQYTEHHRKVESLVLKHLSERID